MCESAFDKEQNPQRAHAMTACLHLKSKWPHARDGPRLSQEKSSSYLWGAGTHHASHQADCHLRHGMHQGLRACVL